MKHTIQIIVHPAPISSELEIDTKSPLTEKEQIEWARMKGQFDNLPFIARHVTMNEPMK